MGRGSVGRGSMGRGSVGQRLSGQRLRSRRLTAEPPQCPAPAPRPSPTSALFRAEFVSIIELPATYLKSLTRPLEERCIARSKSFELFFSSQNSEQQAIVCLNLVMCSDRLPCFLFFQSRQEPSVISDRIDSCFKQNSKINKSRNKQGRREQTPDPGCKTPSGNLG